MVWWSKFSSCIFCITAKRVSTAPRFWNRRSTMRIPNLGNYLLVWLMKRHWLSSYVGKSSHRVSWQGHIWNVSSKHKLYVVHRFEPMVWGRGNPFFWNDSLSLPLGWSCSSQHEHFFQTKTCSVACYIGPWYNKSGVGSWFLKPIIVIISGQISAQRNHGYKAMTKP